MAIHIPSILLSIPRNPVTALGLPLALGMLSGSGTAKVARGEWYKVVPYLQHRQALMGASDRDWLGPLVDLRTGFFQ
jgi:hypothetical protein